MCWRDTKHQFYSRSIFVLHLIFLFTVGITSTRARKTLKDSEKAVLLLHNLRNLWKSNLLNGLKFPIQIKSSSYYRFLEFDTQQKIDELRRLEACGCLTKQSVSNAYSSLKIDVWRPILVHETEKLFMEKVIWGTRIRKVAGNNCLICLNLIFIWVIWYLMPLIIESLIS